MNHQQEILLKSQLLQLAQNNRFLEAEQIARQLLQIKPSDLETWYAFAQILQAQGKREEAVHAFKKSVEKTSKHLCKALDQLIELCIQLENFEDGLKAAEQRVRKDPKDPWSLYRKGYCLIRLFRAVEGRETLERAHRLAPKEQDIHATYAEVLAATGYGELAVQEFDKGQLFNSDFAKYARYLEFHNYCGNLTDETIYKRFVDFGSTLEMSVPQLEPPEFNRDKNRRIRVGYLSPDLRKHSVAFFLKPIFEMHNKEVFEIFAYSDINASCDENLFFRQHADHWCESSHLSDEDLVDKIREDGVDILVDLAAYTAIRCRMRVFAMRAAPIQINYLGFPNTSGLSRMDYRLVDDNTDPRGLSDAWNSEQLIRLKPSFLCFSNYENSPLEIMPLPALENGYITFASFNNGQKITDKQLSVWAAILNSVPNSKLLIKNATFVDESAKRIYRQRCKKMGIDLKRLTLTGFTKDIASHLSVYQTVDIHLDTHPYSGTTTTFEALWMGVPTLTLQGASHRSRVSASILKVLGLDALITNTESEYVTQTIKLASDLNALSILRKGLRGRLERSPLMDKQSFTRELEAFYLEAFSVYPEKVS